jgi:phosphoribosyl 1,2-cyclic phosphodiesterase
MGGRERTDFSVRFWGVRGSIATPDAASLKYGGNTSCLEVRCGDALLILDGGTGVRYLGRTLTTRPLAAQILLTHTHFDHVCGLPFFAPFFDPENRFGIWSGHLRPARTTRQALTELMASPFHPVPPEIFKAAVDYHDFAPGDTIEPVPGVRVRTALLSHPDAAVGYRIEFGARSLAYVTDTEHVPGKPDARILGLIRGADIFVYDAMYTDEEFPAERGKGHSTWQEGARLADAAGVGLYVAFHHDPSHDDTFLDRVALDLEARRPGSLLAREGLVLEPAKVPRRAESTVTRVTAP